MNALWRIALDRPRSTLLVLGLLTVLAGASLMGARFDASLETAVPANDPERVYLEEIRSAFGHDEVFVVALSRPDGLTRRAIDSTVELVDQLREVEGTAAVLSPFTVPLLTPGTFLLETTSAAERTDASIEDLVRLLREDPLLSGFLISAKSGNRAPTWAVLIELVGGDQHTRESVVLAIDEAVANLPSGLEARISGLPYLKVALIEHMIHDLKVYGILSGVVLVIVLLIAIGSLRGMVLPLLVVIATVIWTFGLMVATGNSVNSYSSMIPPLLLFIGITDGIHVFVQYQEELAIGGSPRLILERTMANVGTPCLYTTITTAIGFASLSVSGLGLIRVMGLFMGVGIVFALVLSFTLLPAALLLLGPPKRAVTERVHRGVVTRVLERMGEWTIAHRRIALWSVPCILLLGTIGVRHLRIETNFLRYFHKRDPVVENTLHIEEHLIGTTNLDVVLTLPGGSDLTRPDVLDAIQQVEEELGRFTEVTKVVSPRLPLLRLHRALTRDATASLPSDPVILASEVAMMQTPGAWDPFRGLVDRDSGRLRVRAFMRTVPSPRMANIRQQLDVALDTALPDQARITGTVPLLLRTMDNVVWGQMRSFVLIFVLILVMMSLLMRSFGIGLLAMIPNIIPVYFAFGMMGLTLIPLSNVTAVNSCVGLGIAIDDTIHYLVRFRRELGRSADYARAVVNTARGIGRALVFTTVVLVVGFSVFFFSDFRNTSDFSVAAISILVIALYGALVLLPAALLRLRPFGSSPGRIHT
jgi:predicted RND superfamily exporter protein